MCKWLYRIESKTPDNGLWYNDRGEYVWGCRGCSGSSKDLPMGYDERYRIDGLNWYSSCTNIDDLFSWFSPDDIKYLCDNGFDLLRYLAVDYVEFDKETVFRKDTAMKREKISLETLINQCDPGHC